MAQDPSSSGNSAGPSMSMKLENLKNNTFEGFGHGHAHSNNKKNNNQDSFYSSHGTNGPQTPVTTLDELGAASRASRRSGSRLGASSSSSVSETLAPYDALSGPMSSLQRVQKCSDASCDPAADDCCQSCDFSYEVALHDNALNNVYAKNLAFLAVRVHSGDITLYGAQMALGTDDVYNKYKICRRTRIKFFIEQAPDVKKYMATLNQDGTAKFDATIDKLINFLLRENGQVHHVGNFGNGN